MQKPVVRGRWRRYLMIILRDLAAIVVGLYVALSLYIDLNQDRFTFPAPSSYPKDTPASAGLAFEDLHIPVNASGEQIHGWYVPAVPASSKAILFFHGNGYTIESSIDGEITGLHQSGANILMIDYRGYGSSSPRQANGERASEDGRAALRYLVEQRRVPIQNIFFVGRSIGTGIAARLAAENPEAAGLVLLSAFTRLTEVARQDPVMRFLPLELMGSRNDFRTLEKIPAIRVSVLLVVGSKDELTPAWMTEKLMKQANEPKKLCLIPGAGHNDLWEIGGNSLVSEIRSFVESHGLNR